MTTATDMLAKYLAAELAILEGKEARLGDRSLKMEDLLEIRNGRKEWEALVAGESRQAAGTPALGGATFAVARMDE
jgi:hypothetical protein